MKKQILIVDDSPSVLAALGNLINERPQAQDKKTSQIMTTGFEPRWPFLSLQGQLEFLISDKFAPFKRCERINKNPLF